MILIILTDLSVVFNMTITYLLCLAFLGVSKPFAKYIFPILIMSSIALASKAFFHLPTAIHSLIILISCLLLVKVVNWEVSWLLTILSTFFSLVVLLFGGLLWPFVYFLFGITPNQAEPYTWEWLYLGLAEAVIPFIVLIILKVKRISLMKYLAK